MYILVGVTGFEPAASWSRTKRTTKLCHTPMRLLLYFFVALCDWWGDRTAEPPFYGARLRTYQTVPHPDDIVVILFCEDRLLNLWILPSWLLRHYITTSHFCQPFLQKYFYMYGSKLPQNEKIDTKTGIEATKSSIPVQKLHFLVIFQWYRLHMQRFHLVQIHNPQEWYRFRKRVRCNPRNGYRRYQPAREVWSKRECVP